MKACLPQERVREALHLLGSSVALECAAEEAGASLKLSLGPQYAPNEEHTAPPSGRCAAHLAHQGLTSRCFGESHGLAQKDRQAAWFEACRFRRKGLNPSRSAGSQLLVRPLPDDSRERLQPRCSGSRIKRLLMAARL